MSRTADLHLIITADLHHRLMVDMGFRFLVICFIEFASLSLSLSLPFSHSHCLYVLIDRRICQATNAVDVYGRGMAYAAW